LDTLEDTSCIYQPSAIRQPVDCMMPCACLHLRSQFSVFQRLMDWTGLNRTEAFAGVALLPRDSVSAISLRHQVYHRLQHATKATNKVCLVCLRRCRLALDREPRSCAVRSRCFGKRRRGLYEACATSQADDVRCANWS
jgi:hypothetical protein